MASYQEMVKVTISLQTAIITQAGFGASVFIGAHSWFTERVRIYTSLDQATDLPTASDEYKALASAFSADPKPSSIKVGRREVDLVTCTPDAATAIGQVYKLTVVGTDLVAVAATFTTTTGSETPTEIATALVAGLGGLVGVTVVDATGSLTLAKAGVDPFAVTLVSDNNVVTNTATETAATTLAAIELEDQDFYFVAAHDKTAAYILAMADAVEAREKIYFTSSAASESILAYTDPADANDALGKLFEGNYLRTSGWFHQNAATTFPEMGYIQIGAVRDPGKVVWANNPVEGQPTARDPATGFLLTVTQRNALTQRNASFTEIKGGVNVSSAQSGKVAGNEWVDVIRNRDFLVARITEAYQAFFIDNPVIPHTNFGITRAEAVLSNTLSRYVETEGQPNILRANEPFVITFPSEAEVDPNDKANRIYNGTFAAVLAAAIQIGVIQGTLTNA